jgi:hypothetical protein
MTRLTASLRSWLPIAVAVTIVCGVAYVTSQQVYRMSANDPQTWIANDTLARISAGEAPLQVVGEPKGDIAEMDGPFIVVFDSKLQPVTWSATSAGSPPAPPEGVLKEAMSAHANAVTWQPSKGHRYATVSVAEGKWIVFVGRSLTEVERRIDNLGTLVFLGWGAAIVLSFATTWLFRPVD